MFGRVWLSCSLLIYPLVQMLFESQFNEKVDKDEWRKALMVLVMTLEASIVKLDVSRVVSAIRNQHGWWTM